MDTQGQKIYPTIDSQQGHQQNMSSVPPSYGQSHGQAVPPPYIQGQSVPVVTQQPTTIIVQSQHLGPNSQPMVCPSCQASISTSVKYEPATKTHLFAGLFCLLGLWCGCCLIPYCVDSCQNANHTCPNCGSFLGTGN
ncbi:CLUMA_CG014483, isoform A [Clunio marinus]|uniref:CLUMA_CG014483, isoform A n=1 Tax=Clunio marinus TaxID=568069 RepID=A0A1J1INJ0_9DIPT|nr:CLUMA_CG014483, isoform A [Clunio marinus]